MCIAKNQIIVLGLHVIAAFAEPATCITCVSLVIKYNFYVAKLLKFCGIFTIKPMFLNNSVLGQLD